MYYGLIVTFNSYQSPDFQKEQIRKKYTDCEFVYELSEVLKVLKDKDVLVVTDILRLFSLGDFSSYDFDTVFNTVFKNYQAVFSTGADISVLSCPSLDSEIFRSAIMHNLTKGTSSVEMAVSEILESQIKLILFELYTKNYHKRQSIRSGIREAEKKRSRKGIKLNIKKQKPCKDFMLKNLKDFGGEMSNDEVLEKLGISRNTFFKYKKELVATFGTKFNTDDSSVSDPVSNEPLDASISDLNEKMDKSSSSSQKSENEAPEKREDKKKGSKSRKKNIDETGIEGQTSLFDFL